MQTPLQVITLLYIALPALCGLLTHIPKPWLRDTFNTIVMTPLRKIHSYKNLLNLHFLLSLCIKLYRYFKRADALELVTLLLITAIAILYLAIGLTQIGVIVSRGIRLFLFALATLIPVVFFLLKLKLIPFFKRHYTFIKWGIGLVTLVATYVTGIFSDWLIVQLTDSRAENFPSAQKALTITLLITFWWVAAVAVGSIAYLLQAFNLVRIMLLDVQEVQSAWAKFRFFIARDIDLTPYKKLRRAPVIVHEMTFFVGLGLFTTLSLTIWQTYLASGNLEPHADEIIVLTTFHASPEACGLPGEKDVFIAILPMGKMIAATRLPDSKYVFEPGECKPQTYKPRAKKDIGMYRVSL